MRTQWFDVDKAGLGKQAEEHGKGRLIGELVQNALDEEGVTSIEISVEMIPGRSLANVIVVDDSPEGFRNLADAYTLFAKSYKRDNPEQRGQFNFGEKLVLSVCEEAYISTTKGTVNFDHENGRTERPRTKQLRGSEFWGRMKMTREEFQEVCNYLRSMLLPDDIAVRFNGERLLARKPLHEFEASLPTMAADEEGVMRARVRKTRLAVYEALSSEVPSLYEMGLPIVETGDKWHVDVRQKVPLNRDRTNVTPSYLRTMRTLLLNEMNDRLTADDANEAWVRQGSSDSACSPEAINRVLDLRFGEKRAAYDPSDAEANKKWVSMGGTVVHGGMLNAQEWANAKAAAAIVPAGRLCPTPKAYSDDPNAPPVKVVPENEWTEGMNSIVAYAKFLGQELMAVGIVVRIVNTTNRFAACYGNRNLDFNRHALTREWFDHGATTEVDELLIHEFGHQYSGDHLSSKYHDALCRLGAKMKRLALEKPDLLRKFMR